MMDRAFQETGVFPWTKGADFSGPLAVSTPSFFYPNLSAICHFL